MSDPLLLPFQLGAMTIKNRIVSTCHAPALAEEGMPKERYQRYHLEKVEGSTEDGGRMFQVNTAHSLPLMKP